MRFLSPAASSLRLSLSLSLSIGTRALADRGVEATEPRFGKEGFQKDARGWLRGSEARSCQLRE